MGCTVRLCDDALFNRTMIGAIISEAGFRVIGQAENGDQAVEQYERLRPDVVILDIVMPGMNGLDAARAIRRLDPNACILMCSAMGQQKLMDEAVAAGAQGFIVKPFTQSRVLEALDGAVNR